MIVCVCEGVSDRDVRAAANRGAQTLDAIKRDCRAGGDCGMCRPDLRKLLREARCNGQQSRR